MLGMRGAAAGNMLGIRFGIEIGIGIEIEIGIGIGIGIGIRIEMMMMACRAFWWVLR